MDGLTAYGYARDEGFRAAMSYLEALKVPASVGGWPVGNKSPACKAVLAGDLAAIAALPASAFSEKAARTSDGVPSTALHLAAESGNAKVIAALAARKVDWDAADRYGRRPLELAVLAGKAEAVRALMAAGADPNALDDNGETPLSRAVAARSPLARLMLDAGAKPDWSSLSLAAVVSSTPEEAARLSGGNWGTDSVDAITDFGRPDLLAAFGSTVKHETKGLPELIKDSKESVAAFEAYEKKAAEPSAGKALPADQRERKGSYTLTLDSWSPWMDVDPGLDLKKYPVEVYVPKEYDGSKPYGLVISMLNAKGSSQQPKSEYLASLSSRRLIYVGFDPYNRVFEDGTNDDYRFTNHERFILAILYRMLGAYGLDRSRIYLAGFSWGGRLTGEIVPKWPLLFSGGIAVGGCFTSGNRIVPSYRLARERATMVCVSKDWDYNRGETRNGYNVFAALGYEAYYLQEPLKGHSRISGEYLERALGLLDAAAARRAAAKK
jgi:predicted esterase